MWTIYKYTMARMRGQTLGWGFPLALLAYYLADFYQTTLAKSQVSLQELVQGLPPKLIAGFGNADTIFTLHGFLAIKFFSLMPLILGIFAISAGGALLANDEENGTLDLLLSYPVSRADLFWGRLLAFFSATGLIMTFIWAGIAIVVATGRTSETIITAAFPEISLWSELLLFGTLTLFLSMILPSRSLASILAGLLLVASFFITFLARIDNRLAGINKLSPLHYFQSGDVAIGLKIGWVAGLLAFALIFTLLAWWRFRNRDIRVAGEGNWPLPITLSSPQQ